MTKLNREFYIRDTLTVAKELLGKILVHNSEGKLLKGKIVETEAYLGLNDRAAHSYGGKMTKRVEAMYSIGGTSYVYLIWGMYNCFNVTTQKEGVPEAVLIRAIEPMENIDQMIKYRYQKQKNLICVNNKKEITNGPGKLTMALNIDRRLNKEDLCGDTLYLQTGEEEKFIIVETKRIGIDYSKEAIEYPYRFYIKDNPYVSKL